MLRGLGLGLGLGLCGALAVTLLLLPDRVALRATQEPLARVTELRLERHSADGRCSVSVLYPQVAGMADEQVEQRVNRFLTARWLGPTRMALDTAAGDCPTVYLGSTGFDAYLAPTGLLSLKRTQTVMRGNGFGDDVTKECFLIDLRRGGRLEVAHILGDAGLARLSSLVAQTLRQHAKSDDLRRAGLKSNDLALAPGNFSSCTDGHNLIVELGQSLLQDGRTSVEVSLPLATFPALRGLQTP